MKLSVIIPDWNEERDILRTLRSLQSEQTTFPLKGLLSMEVATTPPSDWLNRQERKSLSPSEDAPNK